MKITEKLASNDAVNAIAAAVESLPGGADALNSAISEYLAPIASLPAEPDAPADSTTTK